MKHVAVNRALLGWSLFVTAFVLAGFTLPGSDFQAGDVIRAEDVNARFNALADGVAALEGSVASLQADAAVLAGEVHHLPDRPGQIRFILRVSAGSSGPLTQFYDSSGGTTAPQAVWIMPGLLYIILPDDYPWSLLTHPTFAQIIDDADEPAVVTVHSIAVSPDTIRISIHDADGIRVSRDFWLYVMNPISDMP